MTRPTIHSQIATVQMLKDEDALGELHRKKRMRDTEATFHRLSLAGAIESLEWLRDNRADCIEFIQAKKRGGQG